MRSLVARRRAATAPSGRGKGPSESRQSPGWSDRTMLDGLARRLLDPPLGRAGRALARRGVPADGLTAAGLVRGLAARRRSRPGRTSSPSFSSPRTASSTASTARVAGVAPHRPGRLPRHRLRLRLLRRRAPRLRPPRPGRQRARRRGAAVRLLRQRRELPRLRGGGREARPREPARGAKSIYFTAGLAEGTETIVCFAAMMRCSRLVPVLAYGFAVLTLTSAAARVALAWRAFAGRSGEAD